MSILPFPFLRVFYSPNDHYTWVMRSGRTTATMLHVTPKPTVLETTDEFKIYSAFRVASAMMVTWGL